jgi:hypothetical protein
MKFYGAEIYIIYYKILLMIFLICGFFQSLIFVSYKKVILWVSEALLDASKEIGLEVNSEKTKTKYTFMSRHQLQGRVII